MATSAHPTILVIFGATGDVVAKKILPGLYNLFVTGALPDLFHIVGFSRRELSDEDFRRYIGDLLGEKSDLQRFLQLFSYTRGNFMEADGYGQLAKDLGMIDGEWKTCANKLFYLAVPPEQYETIFGHLSASGLTSPCSDDTGWTRVLVEKPIGMDGETSEKLDTMLGKLFKEEQIYRIEHYLAKEMIRNILMFRFSNDLFEDIWDRDTIERINIRLWESIGVETRGNFYDKVGALRDVGQNHLLQMLALVTMDRPSAFTPDQIRTKRAQILNSLHILSDEDVAKETYRAQYAGYQQIAGVAPGSSTETYFRLKASLDSTRWNGVPMYLEAGKRLGPARKEIEIVFRHPIPCLCPPGDHHRNRIVISMEPEERIQVEFWAKRPGHGFEGEKRVLDFLLRDQAKRMQYTEEYQKVLVDAIKGDQTLFVSTDELRAMWKFIDPIMDAWKRDVAPLHSYTPDTQEAIVEAMKMDDAGSVRSLKKEVGVIGLGKMGAGIARQLNEKGWRVVGYNRTTDVTRALGTEGIVPATTIEDLVKALPTPRVVWLMVPAGAPVDDVLFGSGRLMELLSPGDIVVDGGNSRYTDDAPRAKRLQEKGIGYIDAGVSGGPSGARNGACVMVGGTKKDFDHLEPLFRDISLPGAYRFFEGVGAGHFVKMVHNGIEYGMMQAIAEGFHVMKASSFDLHLTEVADLYQHGSVIESRLVEWLRRGFVAHGEDLDGVSGTVAHTGEGAWTVEAAKELGVAAKIIEGSLQFRKDSKANPDYTGQVLSALREQFGGHAIT